MAAKKKTSKRGAKKKAKTAKKKAARKPAAKKRKTTRSRGRKTAEQEHLEEAFRLATIEGDIDAALEEMTKARDGSRPGPRSKASAISLAEMEGFGRSQTPLRDVAAQLQIGKTTLYAYMRERPELRTAYDLGAAAERSELFAEAIKRARGGSDRLLSQLLRELMTKNRRWIEADDEAEEQEDARAAIMVVPAKIMDSQEWYETRRAKFLDREEDSETSGKE